MPGIDLRPRTKRFALSVLKFSQSLPAGPVGRVISQQMLRSGTAVGANYRAACRAKSRADFVAKMKIVEEELDETMYWLELLEESGTFHPTSLPVIRQEAEELLRITVRSIRTARGNQP
jgi:four helix bundle protein